MDTLRFAFQAMASPCEIVLGAVDPAAAAKAAAAAEAEVRRIEAKYSRFQPASVIGQINACAHAQAIALDAETSALMDYADSLHRLSDGLFDITTGLLQSAWDFKAGRLPEQAVLDDLLAHVGWSHVQREANSLRTDDPRVRLDFGGFGKEYAADRATGVLIAAGMKSGYIDLGGDIRVIGPKPDGSAWQMGIRHPRKTGGIFASMPMTTGALATSGDYERYFEKDGRHYCHILSPQTGWPVRFWQSVSVLAPLATTAGATCTIAMLKQEEGLDFLQQSGFPFLAIDADGQPHTHNNNELNA